MHSPAKGCLGLLEATVLWVARRWLPLVMSALAIYISLPWLAPTLAKAGFSGPANFIYTIYSPPLSSIRLSLALPVR